MDVFHLVARLNKINRLLKPHCGKVRKLSLFASCPVFNSNKLSSPTNNPSFDKDVFYFLFFILGAAHSSQSFQCATILKQLHSLKIYNPIYAAELEMAGRWHLGSNQRISRPIGDILATSLRLLLEIRFALAFAAYSATDVELPKHTDVAGKIMIEYHYASQCSYCYYSAYDTYICKNLCAA